MFNNKKCTIMEELFLLASVNGNGKSYLLILFDASSGSCEKYFKAKFPDQMGAHLREHHSEMVWEKSIITNRPPCHSCGNYRKCTQKGHIALLFPAEVEEIYQFAENEEMENANAEAND